MPNTTRINSQNNAQSTIETPTRALDNNKNDCARLLDIQHRIARNTDHGRMSMCARYAIKSPEFTPTIIGHNGRVKVVGTQLCRSPLCPLCSNIRSKEQADQLERVITYLVPKGWNLYFITFTKSTIIDINKSYLANREGIKKLNEYARNQKRDHGIELVRYSIIEETYSKEPTIVGKGERARRITTAHSHIHSLYAFPPDCAKLDRERMLAGITRTWKDTMKKHGSWVQKDGVDVKMIDDSIFTHKNVSQYLSGIITDKTNLHKELSYSQNKSSKGRSLAELMIDIDENECTEDLKAYQDTINTYYKKQRVFKSRNWKVILEQATKYHDQEINKLARHYVESLMMDLNFIEKIKRISATTYSFMDNLAYCQDQDDSLHYELEVPYDLWDYLGQSQGTIPRLIKGVQIASKGGLIPTSITLLRLFIQRRPNYSNSLMMKDKDVDRLVKMIHNEIQI